MNVFKRIVSILMCAVLVFSMCSCTKKGKRNGQNDTTKENVDPGIDKIGYTVAYIRSDSLNPFEAEHELNKNVSSLLYDSLFALDNTFKAVPRIAKSFTKGNESLTVTIKSGLKFSDGNVITPQDVAYSFEQAKESSNYSVNLKNISSAEAGSENTVIFYLKRESVDEVNNLTFPIIEKAEESDDVSKNDFVPIGSGRYTIKNENGERVLVVNKDRLGGYHPKYNKIGLFDITEENTVQSLFSLGSIDFFTDELNDGTIEGVTAISCTMNLMNFVYVGVNSERSVFSDTRVRRAIGLLLNRNELVPTSFADCAVACSSPFQPNYYGLSDCTVPTIKYNKKAAVELLKEAGYDKVSENGIRYSNEKSLELTLLVNKDNSFKLSAARSLKQSLAMAEINVVLKEYSYENYIEAVEEGAYDLYIGEAKISNNFDFSRFFSEDGSLNYGIDTDSKIAKSYFQYQSGKISMQDFLDVFADELPFYPIAYRLGILVSSPIIKTKLTTSPGDVFYNVDEWIV